MLFFRTKLKMSVQLTTPQYVPLTPAEDDHLLSSINYYYQQFPEFDESSDIDHASNDEDSYSEESDGEESGGEDSDIDHASNDEDSYGEESDGEESGGEESDGEEVYDWIISDYDGDNEEPTNQYNLDEFTFQADKEVRENIIDAMFVESPSTIRDIIRVLDEKKSIVEVLNDGSVIVLYDDDGIEQSSYTKEYYIKCVVYLINQFKRITGFN